ncbi:RTA-like protein [Penicillium atrosanguineum]|uniref:RTA-like protein n=1 Tax=Penicillium atrosanguineum TaxID=1132637 RepID=A0A9W9PWK7_9EURO|nr:RTA-like protein [Penicillium atrosanguineum]KAJ5140178.1 RTA-like protein [Penicillium atrosanguineum]KAJ5315610.1 RTA-like protein [Penicillium atrosanguineum]
MDIDFHPGVNGSSPYVDFYPYAPSATAGYAFMALFGLVTVVHLVLMFPFRAAYFIPLVLGGVCETFGYYGRAWSHESRTEISSWALQEMLILCSPPLIAATVYMVLGRVIRSFGAEHLASMRPKKITVIFVLNDVLCFLTQIGGAGVQVTGDPNVMNIGKKVVLAGLIFSLIVFVFFVWIAATLHRRLQKAPTNILIRNPDIHWRRYMLALYVACFALMVRNLVRTIQFGASETSPVNNKEVYIYVFDGFLMFFSMFVLIVYHPGRLIKKARHLGKVADFHEPLTSENRMSDVPLTKYEPRMMAV